MQVIHLIAAAMVTGVESQVAVSEVAHGVHALVILLDAAKGHRLNAGDSVTENHSVHNVLGQNLG